MEGYEDEEQTVKMKWRENQNTREPNAGTD